MILCSSIDSHQAVNSSLPMETAKTKYLRAILSVVTKKTERHISANFHVSEPMNQAVANKHSTRNIKISFLCLYTVSETAFMQKASVARVTMK